jgi:hypothetical protein
MVVFWSDQYWDLKMIDWQLILVVVGGGGVEGQDCNVQQANSTGNVVT